MPKKILHKKICQTRRLQEKVSNVYQCTSERFSRGMYWHCLSWRMMHSTRLLQWWVGCERGIAIIASFKGARFEKMVYKKNQNHQISWRNHINTVLSNQSIMFLLVYVDFLVPVMFPGLKALTTSSFVSM